MLKVVAPFVSLESPALLELLASLVGGVDDFPALELAGLLDVGFDDGDGEGEDDDESDAAANPTKSQFPRMFDFKPAS